MVDINGFPGLLFGAMSADLCGVPDNATRHLTTMCQTPCRGCGITIQADNYRIADGCPCNSPRGINHGIVPSRTCTCDKCDPQQTGSTRYPPEGSQFQDPNPLSPFKDDSFMLNNLVPQLLVLLAENKIYQAIDLVYDEMDKYLLLEDFCPVEIALREMAKEDRLPLAILLSALTVSLPWKVKLAEARQLVVQAIQRRDPQQQETLLRGLI